MSSELPLHAPPGARRRRRRHGVPVRRAGDPRRPAGRHGLAEAASATCVMTPAKTEGPYFVDELLDRSDIRASKDGGRPGGHPLGAHDVRVRRDGRLRPRSPARRSTSGTPTRRAATPTWPRTARAARPGCAATSVTDADGKVTFTTIWPGWYRGRAVHIHFKVRSSGLEFTSQLFFTDEMNATVFAQAPYSARGTADTTDYHRRHLRHGRQLAAPAPGRGRRRRLRGRLLRRRVGRRRGHAGRRRRHVGRRDPALGARAAHGVGPAARAHPDRGDRDGRA